MDVNVLILVATTLAISSAYALSHKKVQNENHIGAASISQGTCDAGCFAFRNITNQPCGAFKS